MNRGISYWKGLLDKMRLHPIASFCIGAAVIFFILGVSYNLLFQAPLNFPSDSLFNVKEGMSLSEISLALKKKDAIKSRFWFENFVIAISGDTGAMAGDYYFGKPQSVFRLAKRIANGKYDLIPIKTTIPEGYNIFQIASLLSEKLPLFDGDAFLKDANEGYLFPDTYFFTPNMNHQSVISAMRSNFDSKIKKVNGAIGASGRSLDDVIIMASILEEEARTEESRRTIAGILWKRLDIGMALQVDSAFQRVNGKNTYELTSDDLQIDSPYNTYKYAGFPPTPISNPGLDSIIAAITPIETNYFYFLSSKSGKMYYAIDFEEHKQNRLLYLNK